MEEASHRDLTAVERLFRDTFKKPPRGVVARMLGERAEYDYRILNAAPHECGRYFPDVSLLWVEVGEPFLEFSQLPGSRSLGLVAVDQTGAWYLHPCHPEGFQRLLKTSNAINHIPPRALAILICDALLSRDATRYRLIESFADIEQLEASDGYELDTVEAAKVRPHIAAAVVERAEPAGSRLRFAALSGWMHELKQVNLITALIAADGAVTYFAEPLSHRLFARTPVLRY